MYRVETVVLELQEANAALIAENEALKERLKRANEMVFHYQSRAYRAEGKGQSK